MKLGVGNGSLRFRGSQLLLRYRERVMMGMNNHCWIRVMGCGFFDNAIDCTQTAYLLAM